MKSITSFINESLGKLNLEEISYSITPYKWNRDSSIRVLRKGECIMDTAIDTLQQQKDQVKSVKLGFECGIKLKNFNDIEVGDILEAYSLKQI